jgi:hypothetical protein
MKPGYIPQKQTPSPMDKALKAEELACSQAGYDQPVWNPGTIVGSRVIHSFLCAKHSDDTLHPVTPPKCNSNNLDACN